jgi:hypothetical protein
MNVRGPCSSLKQGRSDNFTRPPKRALYHCHVSASGWFIVVTLPSNCLLNNLVRIPISCIPALSNDSVYVAARIHKCGMIGKTECQMLVCFAASF